MSALSFYSKLGFKMRKEYYISTGIGSTFKFERMGKEFRSCCFENDVCKVSFFFIR